MNKRHSDFPQAALSRAVQLALLAMFAAAPGWASAQAAAAPAAAAQDDEAAKKAAAQKNAAAAMQFTNEGNVESLTCPENYFEVGAGGVSRHEPKFGEYNGMPKSGAYGLANFKVAGGDSHCMRGGNMGWQVYGTNLGTTSRELGGSVGEQGRWSLGLSYEQLRHYTTTGFQTPYQGAQGGNLFVLPPNFGVINTGLNGGTRGLTPDQLAAFRSKDVYNQRQNYNVTGGYALNNEWDVKLKYKHIERTGAKLMGGATDVYDMTSLGGFSFAGQDPSLKLNPTKDSTDIATVSANWTGDKAYASFEYYGSYYHDDYRGVSFSNPYVTGAPATGAIPPGGYPLDTISTPPSNLLNQLSVTGGYLFSQKTKLHGGLSLGLNTQNSSFDGTYTSTPNTAPGLPRSSLNGRVINTHADARLTHQFSNELGLNTGFRFDQRNNRTGVNQYTFINIAGSTSLPTNAPMSYRRTVGDAALTYRLTKNQRVSLTYKYDHMQRWCSNDAANNAQGVLPANAPNYYVTASCAQVPRNTDNSLAANYKANVTDKIKLDLGYTFADRSASINASFYNPMQAFNQGYENYGWLAFFQAPRREHALKTRASWQITDQLDVGLSGGYTYTNYTDSTLGVQVGHAGNINLDATYQYSDNASYGAYASWQKRSRYMISASDRNPVAAPVNLWNNRLTDSDFDIGLNGKQKMLRGKFELTEDISYNLGRSWYDTELLQNIAPATGNSGQIPPIRNKVIQLRLVGTYHVDKTSAINVGYMFQRMLSNDYFYNGYQSGYTPSVVIPANLQSPNYKVHMLFVTYRRSF